MNPPFLLEKINIFLQDIPSQIALSKFLFSGITILVIIIGALIVIWLGEILISKSLQRILDNVKDNVFFQKERGKTVGKILISSFKFTVWIITILIILSKIGVNILPLLASLGLAGLALGIGAKNLIQDYLAGIFILLEDQYRIGEEIEILGIRGKVKEMSLRRTILEDAENTLHYIPNGQITRVSNFSRAAKNNS